MWIKTLPRLCCHQWHLGSIILFLLLLVNLQVPRVLLWIPWQFSRKTNILKPQSDLRKHNAKWCKEDSGAGKILKKMGQIESQIFSSSYVAKVILGTISPVQPKSDDAAGVCQAPAPVLRRAICFPSYPLAHRVRRRFFLRGGHFQKTCFQPPPLLSVPGIEHRLPLLFQTLACCRWQLLALAAGDLEVIHCHRN